MKKININYKTDRNLKALASFSLVLLPENELDVFELELLVKAEKWHIPYDKENPDFSMLEDDVCCYESLIKQTIGLEIGWDYEYYDPIGLEQAIEEALNREGGYTRALQRDYYAERGV